MKTKVVSKNILPVERIEQRIFLIRGKKVMLDSDLAELYGVSTKRLNEALKRNSEKFPPDFMFQLTRPESELLRSQFETSNLRSQIATSSLKSQDVISRKGHGGRRYSPNVFTEHGALSLSFILKSKAATDMSIYIIRAFIKLRELSANHKHLADKIAAIDKIQKEHGKTIEDILIVVDKLLKTQEELPSAIGFTV